ncbi:MAG: TonB-dependent receptor [Flavobacteriia bacterium]|nr:MAG: TonB-dependent receptor [Flavobacteriia bacterium]
MTRLLTFFILILYTTSTLAQTVTIKDKSTGEPLEYVVLLSAKPDVYTTTNAQGKANLSDFDEHNAIEISYLGYETQVVDLGTIREQQFIIDMVPSFLNMEEVVISATRWNQHTYDTPATIVAINPKTTQLYQPQTAADLLSVSGKVYVQKSQQGGGSPMIRGFATNRLLYTVDGVRMNTAIFRSGNIQNVISLDPYSMEKAEVVFGPGSVIYGSDAIGGVMSFKTLTPRLSVSDKLLIDGQADLRLSSANMETTGHFDVNLGTRRWSMLTSLSYNNYEDLRMGTYGPDDYIKPFNIRRIDNIDVSVANTKVNSQSPSGYSQYNLMQKVRFKPNDQWDLNYSFHYSEVSAVDRYDRLIISDDNQQPKFAEWYYGPQKWMMNLLNLSIKKDNKWFNGAELRLAHQYFEESRINRKFNKDTRKTRVEKVNAYSVNFDLYKDLSEKDKLFYGIEWVTNDVNSVGEKHNISTMETQATDSRYPNSIWTNYGIYATAQHEFSDKLKSQLGLRYGYYHINSTFDTRFFPLPFDRITNNNGALTGSLGFVYKPRFNLVFNANVATAYRAPNVDDIGKIFDSAPGSVVVPNPDLKPEYAYNIDVGVARIFNKIIKLEATGYATYLKDALVRRDFNLNGETQIMYDGTLSDVQAIQNAAFARVFGVQAGFEIKLPNGLGLSSDYNIQKGIEELSDGTTSPSRHAPPSYGTTRITYNANKLYMQLYTTYMAEKSFDNMPREEAEKSYLYAKDANGNPYAPSWYTLNLKANYTINSGFTIGVGLENITDQRYRPYSSGIAAPGRNYIMTVKAVF